MLMCSCEKVDFNITSRTVARLVFEAEQDHRNGGNNSSNGRYGAPRDSSSGGRSVGRRRGLRVQAAAFCRATFLCTFLANIPVCGTIVCFYARVL